MLLRKPVSLLILLSVVATAVAEQSANEDFVWQNGLKTSYFGDREIIESDDIIQLEAPRRAEDAAIVPIQIKAQIPQRAEHYIKTVSLIIDQNPGPLAGRFHFTPLSGRADLAMRVRINAYTPVRAVAETSDGKLYMSRRFVKASGGCSAPAAGDLDQALTRLGKMKLKTGEALLNQPTLAQLNISHPNITGLQMDQITRLYMPPHFLNRVEVAFNGRPVLSAETDISISQDPSFRFYFVPDQPGELSVQASDNTDKVFTRAYQVQPEPNS